MLLEVFEDFHYTDELEGPGVHGLIFRTRIGKRTVEGLDLIRNREDGLIIDFTVMVRPLSATIAGRGGRPRARTILPHCRAG